MINTIDADYIYVVICSTGLLARKHIDELVISGYMNDYRELINMLLNEKEILHFCKRISSYSTKLELRIIETHNNLSFYLNQAEHLKNVCEANNIHLISIFSEYYPILWKNLKGMPKVFFCKGNLDRLIQCNTNGSVAIVGSRYPSHYAKEATVAFTEQLISKDITIVSGMALGIDGIAHKTALDYSRSTIAVVPGGCDIIYPYQNSDIYNNLISNGLIISELLPGTKIIKQYFPSRNRLISALSDCTLIMEAGASSGTLHTASFAANQGRSVYVLPNTIYNNNAIGGLELIRDGAKILLNSNEVIDEVAESVYSRLIDNPELINKRNINSNSLSSVPVIRSNKKIQFDRLPAIWDKLEHAPTTLDNDEIRILLLDILTGKHKCMDEILREIPVGMGKLSIILTEMEINGEIYTNGENYCTR